jgi:hypothetical protein
MTKYIHHCVADDDVQTDEDCRQNAIRSQQRSLKAALMRFTDDSPRRSAQKVMVKNLALGPRYRHCVAGRVEKLLESEEEG